MPIDLLEKSSPRDLLAEGPKDLISTSTAPRDLLASKNSEFNLGKTAIDSAKQTIENLPLFAGFTPKQIMTGQKALSEIIERPIAGLRGIAKEGLGGFKKGLIEPEKYPVGTFAEVYQKTFPKMSPIISGTLGTIADAGYYFGVPEALTRIATAGKLKLLEGTIQNINEALKVSGETRMGVVNIPEETLSNIAKDKDIGEVVGNYLKSKNIKIPRKTGLLKEQVLPETVSPEVPISPETVMPKDIRTFEIVPQAPKGLLAPEMPVTAPKDLLAIPTPSKAEIPPAIEDLKGKQGIKNEFKVGDVLDPQGNTNMAGKVKITGIEGNTLKFTDSEGTEFSGMARSQVKKLIEGGSWKKGETGKIEGLSTDEIEIMRRQKRDELQNPKETLLDRISRKEKEIKKLEQFNEKAEDIDDTFESQGEIDRLTREVSEDKSTFEMMKDKYGVTTPKEGKVSLSDEDRDIVMDIYNKIDSAMPPQRFPTIDEEGYIAGYTGNKSGYPKYFQDKGFTRKQTLGILDKKLKGEKLTEKQQKIFDTLFAGGKEEYYAEQQSAESKRLAKEGISQSEIDEANRIGEEKAQSEVDQGDISFNTQELEKLQETLPTGEKQNLIPGTKTTLPPTPIKAKTQQEENLLKGFDTSTPKEKQGDLFDKRGFILKDMLNPAKWDSVRQFIEDDWLRVKRLVQQKGANVTETNNPYEAEIRYWGRIGARTEEADRLISEVDKDIVTTAKKLHISDKLFNREIDRFLIARHAPERNAKHGENAAGMTDKEAFTIRAEIAGKPYAKEVERIADEIQLLNNKTLDTLLEGEVIDKELYDKLRTMYKNHIPLQRVMGEEDDIVEILTKKGFDVQGAGLKRAKGSELEVADILTNVTANYKAALARAEKNIVDNYTLRFARENEYFDGLFEEVKLPMLPVGKVQHRAAVDSGYLAQVRKFAESLGAKVITGGQPGRVLGTYGGKTVERKFATPEEVVSHEVGHFLDDKYKLKQQFYKKGDTKKVGEEIYQFMVDQGQSANRVKKVSERFAHAFEWWLSNRALAKEDLPLFTKAIEGIISGIPELSPLLKIRPTPGLTVESIEEMVFARQKYNTDPKVLPVREKGKQVYLKINDAQLAMALRGVNRQKIDGLLKGVKAFTRFYAGLMTRFNPEFVISNKIRDLQEVAVYLASKNEIGVRGTAEAIIKDPISLKDVTDFIRGKDTEGARLYRQMKMDGGTTGGMGLSTREQLEIDIKKIRSINRNSPRKAVEIVLRSIDTWNTIFEDSSRLSVYRQALKQGVSRNKAAVFAKEASVNFNKMGTGSPVINALYMFSNASVQGTVKMLRAMRNPKVLATVLTLLGGAVYLVSEYNDKQDKDWRKKVSKWDRLNGLNIVIKTKDGIRYITIPISWGLKPIKVFFDELGDLASGHQKNVSEAISGLLAASIEAYNPAGGTDIVSTITPSILDLPVDIARNRSWTGGKIRPDWNNSAPASIQYFDNLRKDAVGQKFIKATREWGEHGLEISPADINYAYEQLIGGTGRFADKTLNTIVGVSQGKVQAKEIPFVSRFYRDIPEEQIREFGQEYKDVSKRLKQQDKDRFYLNQEAELVHAGLKDLPPRNANENLKKIYETNRPLYDKIVDVDREEKSKLTYTERLVSKLGVENGERSKYIWKKVNELKTGKEKNTYLKNLYDKKILTDRVYRQLEQLKK
jgi:hypothetical protein